MKTKKIVWKPHMIAMLDRGPNTARRPVEIINRPYIGEVQVGDGSFPGEEPGVEVVGVRMVPGEPTTMETGRTLMLHEPVLNYKYVHVARTQGVGVFPEDMLRYDCCHLFDHKQLLPEDGWRPGEPVLLYQVTDRRIPTWTEARWASFGWRLARLTTYKLGAR